MSQYALLFTMYNEEKRSAMTQDVVNFYTQHFPIDRLYVVDSANRGTDLLPRTQQAVFDQTRVRSSLKESKQVATKMELHSLMYAFAKLDFRRYTHVIKVTAKYKIENLSDICIDPETELLIQREITPGFQNTEVVGFSVDKVQAILSDIASWNVSAMMEQRVETAAASYVTQKLPKLNLVAPLYPRAWGDTLSFL